MILGFFLSNILTEKILFSMGSSVDMMFLKGYKTVIISSLGVFATAVVVNNLLVSSIKKLDMVKTERFGLNYFHLYKHYYVLTYLILFG